LPTRRFRQVFFCFFAVMKKEAINIGTRHKTQIIICFCLLLLFCNSLLAQSDTVRLGKYLHIGTRLSNPTRYVYEYQDTLGNIIIPQGKYNYLGKSDEYGFISAWRESSGGRDIENNVGFIDIHENILIPFDYSRAFTFKQNLACVIKNRKTGYINRKGETVIPFTYESYKDFSDYGVAVVKKITGQYQDYWDKDRIRFTTKCVLIDTLGNEIIGENHSYQEIKENFPHDNVLWIQKNDKWAFFDLKGNPLTPFIFDEMHPANICPYQPNLWYGERLRWFYKGLIVVEKDNQFAVLNEKMKYAIPWKKYQWISPMNISGLMIVKQKEKYGLLNHQFKLVQPIEFDTISNFPAEEHEQNYPSFWAKKNDKYYIFDTLGCWKDGIEYDNIKLLQANFYLVTKDGNQWRVDRNGSKVIENFTIVRDEGYGFLAKKDSLFGLIDIEGNIVLPFEYEDIICEHLGDIFVKKKGKWGIVNEDNEQLLPIEYDYIAYAWDDSGKDTGNYIVVQNDKFGKITKTGNEIFPCLYDGITTWVEYGPEGHYVMIDNRMGLIDRDGNVLVPVQYDRVGFIGGGTNWAEICDNNKIGLYDTKSKSFFLPLEYDYLCVDMDWFGFKNTPTTIITYKNGIVNVLNEKGEIIRDNVSKTLIKSEFDIDIDAYQYSPCSYQLLMMHHNRTFNAPDCLLETLKEYNVPTESIYYKMEKND